MITRAIVESYTGPLSYEAWEGLRGELEIHEIKTHNAALEVAADRAAAEYERRRGFRFFRSNADLMACNAIAHDILRLIPR